MRIDLPGDAWVELRDPAKVKNRQVRAVLRAHVAVAPEAWEFLRWSAEQEKAGQPVTQAARARGLPAACVEQLWALNNAIAIALIAAWSFTDDDGTPLPITVENLEDELPGPAYHKVIEVTAPLMDEVVPSFQVDPDPASPTEPSSA